MILRVCWAVMGVGVIAALILSGLTTVGAATAESDATPDRSLVTTPEQKMSYVMGISIGASLADMGVDVDVDALNLGIQTSLNGDSSILSEEELDQARKELTLQAREHQEREEQGKAVQNRLDEKTFLDQNKLADGVTTTESGLQYQVVTEGEGPKPGPTDTVRVHYRGTLVDGTEFDSSYSRGEPAVFPVNGVIFGWTEALQLMSVGSKYKLSIPADLAYGSRGAGAMIGPNATLIFEVELLGIE